ncbi:MULTISPECIES: helix-turn-helix domain-containing protein [Eisenbergiella]|uniref:helix-turn-helix domain-containing protein n=1 Tax=Eisenbergiella TaxID=1432051 RepID=UPI0023F45776|nr:MULTISPECIES: helix-turn-helix transcriptional regulator [Eisenbergiella]MDY2652442.1 helix-turn-helix transcriptional regulator [Eisenbergiella porci]
MILELERRKMLYKKFLELLVKNNKTTYQVAKDTHISNSTFSDWKSGRSTPKLDKLKIIADYFDVPLTYFIE